MNAERLLQLYDRVAEAPDAINRLRRFILDLAVRGKLVEQDPKDEAASELLERIAAEKTRLIKEGKIKKRQAKEPTMQKVPYDLPGNWSWATLGTVTRYDAGIKRDPSGLDHSLWLLELEDIEKNTGRLVARVKAGGRSSRSTKSEFQVGDILYGKLRPYLNKVIVADEPGYSTTEIVAIRPYISLCSEYCALVLRCPDFVDYVTRLGQGTKMPRLRTQDAVVAPFPLPPLAEQHRIVAKVDELMTLCDHLEETHNTRETTRDRLTTATLTRLTAPDTDKQNFHTHARFALDTLPALTTRPHQIKILRQTILDLAVCGRLTECSSAETTALSYLESLPNIPKAAKRMLQPLASHQAGGILPASWTWLPLGALINGTDAGWSPQCEDENRKNEEEWAVLKTTAVQALRFDRSKNKKLPGKLAPRPEYVAQVGDILVTRAGPKNRVGVSCVVDTPCPRLMISDKLIRFHVLGELSPRYVALALNAAYTCSCVEAAKSGMAVMQMNISQAKLRTIPIPVPPVAEQHRIVAKVDELIALCDQLEINLEEAETACARLLESVLQGALQPAEDLEAA